MKGVYEPVLIPLKILPQKLDMPQAEPMPEHVKNLEVVSEGDEEEKKSEAAILEVNDEDEDIKMDKDFYTKSQMMSSVQVDDVLLRSGFNNKMI